MTSPLLLRRGTAKDLQPLTGLIDETGTWLSLNKNTDQWSAPWPSRSVRDGRVRRSLAEGTTWVVQDGDLTVASIAVARTADPRLWPNADDAGEPTLYPCRVMVRRSHKGLGLGSGLLTWAALRARTEYGARMARIDVWTTNYELHGYYKGLGFESVGTCDTWPAYPACALFEISIDRLPQIEEWPFEEPFPDETRLFGQQTVTV